MLKVDKPLLLEREGDDLYNSMRGNLAEEVEDNGTRIGSVQVKNLGIMPQVHSP